MARGRNLTPLVGWHPSAELVLRLDAEVKRRGGGRGVRSAILDEALAAYFRVLDGKDALSPTAPATDPDCPHPAGGMDGDRCTACGQDVFP